MADQGGQRALAALASLAMRGTMGKPSPGIKSASLICINLTGWRSGTAHPFRAAHPMKMHGDGGSREPAGFREAAAIDRFRLAGVSLPAPGKDRPAFSTCPAVRLRTEKVGRRLRPSRRRTFSKKKSNTGDSEALRSRQ
jgi:hypothetical protein